MTVAQALAYNEKHGSSVNFSCFTIEWLRQEDTMAFDQNVVYFMELVRNIRTSSEHNTLLGLFECKTKQGKMKLKSIILQPSCNINVIKRRLDATQFFVERKVTVKQLSDEVKHLICVLS